jgi:hypothetical protein
VNKGVRTVGYRKDLREDMALKASTPYLIRVDPRNVIFLDFGKAHAVVYPWERSSVRVTPNIYFHRYVELLNEQNLILFDYDSYCEENQFISDELGFSIMMPRSAAFSIIAGKCFIHDSTVLTVQSDMLELKNCKLLDNFRFVGGHVLVQNSTVGKHGSICAKNIALRHSTCSTLMLDRNRKDEDISIELRNVRGKGIWLGSQQICRMDVRLHHVRLNRLVVETGVVEGKIKLEGTKIACIDNLSSIPITKSVFGYHKICA